MKRIATALLALVLVLTACQFNFNSDESEDNPEKTGYCVTQTARTVQLTKQYSADDRLEGYDVSYIRVGTEDSTRLVSQTQFYSAADTLLYTYVYTSTAEGNKDTVAWYDGSNQLKNLTVYGYDATGRLSSISVYNPSGSLSSASTWTYLDTGTSANQVDRAASFALATDNLTLELKAAVARYYLPSSASWNMEALWGESLTADIPSSGSCSAGADKNETFTFPVKITALSAVPVLTGTIPASPSHSSLWDGTLAYLGSRYSYTDAYGSSLVNLDSAWKPVSLKRDDSRLDQDITVELVYDTAGIVTTKKTWYGSTLALQLDITRDADQFPKTIEASGTVMALPLSFVVTYGANHEITRLDVSSSGALLQYFVFTYTNAPTVPRTLDSAYSFDPFSFAETLLSSSLTIDNYNGDAVLQQSFVVEPQVAAGVPTGVKASVYAPGTGGALGSFNGHFLIAYDNAGREASLASFDKDGNQLWIREFGYGEAFDDLVDDVDLPNETTIAAHFDNLGRMYDNLVPDPVKDKIAGAVDDNLVSSAEYLASFSKNVVFDLVFDLLF